MNFFYCKSSSDHVILQPLDSHPIQQAANTTCLNTDEPEITQKYQVLPVLRGWPSVEGKRTHSNKRKSLVNPHHNLGIYASGTEAAARFIDADLIRWL